jgi:hypothetical protein
MTTQYLLTGSINTAEEFTPTTTFTLTANEELLMSLTQYNTIDFIV